MVLLTVSSIVSVVFRINLTRILAAATVQEFITMIAGGLAGASPHMISATVTALSRLVFEFKGEYTLHPVALNSDHRYR